MSGAGGEFKLSAVLNGHTSDVRAVLLPNNSFALTASRDGSTRVWKRTSQSPPSYDPNESSHGSQYKSSIAYFPPNKEYPEGLVLSAGQDTLIEARQPGTTAEANADAVMVGHGNAVCSLDVCPEADWFVSGSWDSTARIWKIGRWESEVELTGHTATVWAAIAYDTDTIITGSADRSIRVFDVNGKQVAAFDGRDITRALVKLPANHSTGAHFASASNDGVIRLWTLRGDLVGELHGHDSFIYSLAVLPTEEIVSSGEDRTIRIWKGNTCLQVITVPATSVWSVATSPDGDIIAGSSDKVARIFTRDTGRFADAATTAEFEEAVQSSAVPKQQLGAINMSDLPGSDALTRRRGTREGQHLILKDDSGNAILYSWSMAKGEWQKIGAVVDSAASANKTAHNGKEYDYVFDIDIEDGKPALKLPYNVTQNPYEAATKFLQDNELPMTYLEETASFIIKNTQGASLGQQSQSQGADPWGTESRYRPGDSSSLQSAAPTRQSSLPHRDYLPIVMGKPTAVLGQIKKLNAEYSTSANVKLALTDNELDTLSKLVEQLNTYNFQGRPSLETPLIATSVPIALKIATKWHPVKNRLAGIDLLRFIAAAAKQFPTSGAEPVGDILTSGLLDERLLRDNNKLAMISLRFFANLLYGSIGGRALIKARIDSVIDAVKPASEAAHTDVSLAVAVTTLLLNISVFLASEKSIESEKMIDYALNLMGQLRTIIKALPPVDHSANALPLAQTTEPAYRATVALGTIIAGLNRSEVKDAAVSVYDVGDLGEELRAKQYLDEPRFTTVTADIRAALS